MIEELSVVLRKQTPNPPNEWLYETTVIDGGLEKRNFVPFAYLGKNAEPWLQCTNNYKEGYDLLWSLRQEEHTAEDRQSIEAQYAAWQTSNPALAEEIDHAVPIKPEQEQAPEQEGGEG